ncbi:C1 family peptidase [Tunicatimonas pelagia]|uniref:C1 family peptidase n=1 Tax=Tunicatimonas pelagia TaxID=931531 RepID=UPI002664F64E|nr:C1 family peptidase [Tunicatimonas pelagia]WKN45013.1 C1 family peptidase [Tunicatimonas pelagia]
MAKLEIAELQAQLIDEAWDAAPNPITEMSDEEQTIILGATPPDGPPSKTQKETSKKSALAQHQRVSARTGAGAHPSSFDWRSKDGGNYVTAIKSQGGCGSCVAFGVLSVVESMVRITKNMPNYDTDLSEAHLFYCLKGDPNGCRNGWWPTTAYDKVKDTGVAKESYFPYVSSQQSCLVSNGWQNEKLTITNYKALSNVNAIKEHIANVGPVSACFEVFGDFYSYQSGVYRHVSGDSEGWHCISIIGYNDAGGYWIGKNSWGTNWGEEGYLKIKYGECSIEHYGMWGVLGIVDTGWIYKKKITGLWSNSAGLNCYAYIQDEGWKKIANNNRENHFMILSALINAKNRDAAPSIYIKDGKIEQVYA